MVGRSSDPHAALVSGWGTLVVMAITLPFGIRLAAGLLGTAIDRATALPAELPSMAVTFAGQALRTSMRIQQELAELASRGDELLAPLTARSQEHPEWATFDEDEDDEPALRRPPVSGTPGAVTATDDNATGDDHLTGDGSDEPAVTLLDGTPLADVPEPGATGPGETVPTAAGFVVGPVPPAAALTAGATTALTGRATTALAGGTTAALAGGTPGEAVVADPPAGTPTVANARRTTTSRARGRTAIRSDHKLTIAELKERTQEMGVPEVRALLAQEEAGPNRAAYLTLLGNRLMTLQHEDR